MINPLGRFYRLGEGRHVVGWYDKLLHELWLLTQCSSSEREDDWNHWEIFADRDNKVECVGDYWWRGVWYPTRYETYWSEPDMSKEYMVHIMYLEATGNYSNYSSDESC